ncbi:MAG UNVERIFIED_CONTAM: hypothetical protein LVR18_22615 [Planctomycetaceae bacterium]
MLQQALAVLRRQPRGDGTVDVQPITRRGLELADEERFSEAEAALSSAWRISEQQYGPDAPETLRLLQTHRRRHRRSRDAPKNAASSEAGPKPATATKDPSTSPDNPNPAPNHHPPDRPNTKHKAN